MNIDTRTLSCHIFGGRIIKTYVGFGQICLIWTWTLYYFWQEKSRLLSAFIIWLRIYHSEKPTQTFICILFLFIARISSIVLAPACSLCRTSFEFRHGQILPHRHGPATFKTNRNSAMEPRTWEWFRSDTSNVVKLITSQNGEPHLDRLTWRFLARFSNTGNAMSHMCCSTTKTQNSVQSTKWKWQWSFESSVFTHQPPSLNKHIVNIFAITRVCSTFTDSWNAEYFFLICVSNARP